MSVVHVEGYQRPDLNDMIETTLQLLEKHDIRFDNVCRIFVDRVNPSFIRTLKQAVNEDTEYVKLVAYYKHIIHLFMIFSFLRQYTFVIPVTFSKEYKVMVAHCRELMEYQNGMVAIHPMHNSLTTVLRTAVKNGEGSLDKDSMSYDAFDAFRLSLIFWHQ